MRDTYWWADDAMTVARTLKEIDANSWLSNPIRRAWLRNLGAYYSAVLEPEQWETSLVYDGEVGELVRMIVPEARQLTRQFLSLVTKQRLAFQAVAQKDQGDAVQVTRLGNALGNQMVEEQRLDGKAERMAEMTYIMGLCFMFATWRTDRGNPMVVDQDGALLYDGDLEISVVRADKVLYDETIEDWENQDWARVETEKSRWSLIAQFPKLKDEIMRLPSSNQSRNQRGTGGQPETALSDDKVVVYEAYHRPTPAIPGRGTRPWPWS